MLVVTLWLIVVLAVGAVALSGYLSTETRLMRYHIANAQARAWAESGVFLALERLAADAQHPERLLPGGAQTATTYDWLGDEWASFPEHVDDPGTWAVRLPTQPEPHVNLSGQLTIRIVDEERKLDINPLKMKTPPADVQQVFQTLLTTTPETVNLIVDYLDDDSNQTLPGGIEHTDSPAYTAKNAAMSSLAELEGIPNLPTDPAFWNTLRDEVTVAPVKKLNINTVSPALLGALGLTPAVVVAIDTYRHEADGVFDDPARIPLIVRIRTTVAGQDQAILGTFDVTSSFFRIESTVTLDAPAVTCRIEAVVRRGSSAPTPSMRVDGQSFDVLTWSEH